MTLRSGLSASRRSASSRPDMPPGMMRSVSSRLIEPLSCAQISAAAAALEIWAQESGSINLLLTDLIMPGGMSGRELAERLLADKPDLKVIYASGYSNDIVSRHLRLDQGRTFLQKPFSSSALLTTVRRCLDEKTA